MKIQKSEQIDALCDEWSERLQNESDPDLREFWGTVSPELREAMVPFLVPIDVEWRRQRRPGLRADDYADLGPTAVRLAGQCLQSECLADQRNRVDCASAIFRFSGDSLVQSVEMQTPQVELPSSVGEFRVVETIGAGGMGVVVKGEHRQTGEPVAIKFLRPELSDKLDVRRRFLREASAIGSVNHPHVVRVLRLEESPSLCLVMEYVRGRTLADRLRELGTLPLSEILLLGLQIAEGLEAIHRQGITHRDLKPQNILLQDDGRLWARISDFGVARFAGDPQITRSGEIVGSAGWLSPEQAQEQTVTLQSDLFSFGCLLYAMACGQSPFQRAGLMPTLMAVIGDPVVGVSEIRPDLPVDLCRLIEKLLEKSPRGRPRSIGVVRRALQQLAKSYGVSPVLVPVPPATEAPCAAAENRWRRRTLLYCGTAAVVMSVLGKDLLLRSARVSGRFGSLRKVPLSSTIDRPEVQRPTVPRTPPLLHPEAGSEQATVLLRQWSELLQLPKEIAGPAGLKFLLIPPLQLPVALQTADNTSLPAFYTANRPLSWQQFHSLLENEMAATLLARLTNSSDVAREQSAECLADQAVACVAQVNGRRFAESWPAAAVIGNRRLAGRLPRPVEWQVLGTMFGRRPPLLAGIVRPSAGFRCWLQPSSGIESGLLQIGEGWELSGRVNPQATRQSAGLWLICSGEDLQKELSIETPAA